MGFNRNLFLEQPVDNDFICGICLDVLEDPTIACSSGHNYCRSCLTQTHSGKCPECRNKIFEFMLPNRPVQNMILRKQVRCSVLLDETIPAKKFPTASGGSTVDTGCVWTGDVSDLMEHHKTCEYAVVKCTNGCGQSMPRFELQKHLESECSHRTVTCLHCDKKLQSKDMDNHKREDCPKVLVACEFCDEQVLREALGKRASGFFLRRFDNDERLTGHYRKCQKLPLRCEFYDCGCTKPVLREELDAHYQSHAKEHARLLREQRNKLSEDLYWSEAIRTVWVISADKLRADGPLVLKSSPAIVDGIEFYFRLDANDEKVQASLCAKRTPVGACVRISDVSIFAHLPHCASGANFKQEGEIDIIIDESENNSVGGFLTHKRIFSENDADEGSVNETEVTLSDLVFEANQSGMVEFNNYFKVRKPSYFILGFMS